MSSFVNSFSWWQAKFQKYSEPGQLIRKLQKDPDKMNRRLVGLFQVIAKHKDFASDHSLEKFSAALREAKLFSIENITRASGRPFLFVLSAACNQDHASLGLALIKSGLLVHNTDWESAANLKQTKVLLAMVEAASLESLGGPLTVYTAAKNGLTEVLKAIFERMAPDEKNRYLNTGFGYEGQTPLMEACKEDHVQAALMLIEAGSDIVVFNKAGETALHCAAETGLTVIVEKILLQIPPERKLDVLNAEGRYEHRTPLSIACKKGHVEIAELLIQAGAYCFTAFHFAAARGLTHLLQPLLDTLPMVFPKALRAKVINAKGRDSRTSLLEACKAGHASTAQRLIELGADTTIADSKEKTVLYYAAKAGLTDLISLIVNQTPAEKKLDLLNATGGRKKWTAVIRAIAAGQSAAADLIIDVGADVTIRAANYETALHFAAERGFTGLVKKILDIAPPDKKHELVTEIKFIRIDSALCKACRGKHAEIAELLLDAGANENEIKGFFQHPLLEATSSGLLEAVKSLVESIPTAEKELFVNVRSFYRKRTPLMEAAAAGHIEVALFLILAGADVTLVAKKGTTALQEAAAKGLIDLVREIAARLPKDPSLPFFQVYIQPAIKSAYAAGHYMIVKLLMDRQADRTMKVFSASLEDSTVFQIYAPLLSSCSSYFHALFSKDYTESKQKLIEMHEIDDHKAFGQLIEYFYTDSLEIEYGNFRQLVIIASKLFINDVAKKFKTWLDGHPECQHWRKKYLALLEEENMPSDIAEEESSQEERAFIASLQAGKVATIQEFNDACDKGWSTAVQILLFRGHSANFCYKDCTPLMRACSGGHAETALLLIENKANVSIRSHRGTTALHYAAETGLIGVVKAILSKLDYKKLDFLNTRRKTLQSTALITSCSRGHEESAHLLIEAGADVSCARSDGTTALHFASQNGQARLVRQLIENVIPEKKMALVKAFTQNKQRTALMLAHRNGHIEVVQFLLKAQADRQLIGCSAKEKRIFPVDSSLLASQSPYLNTLMASAAEEVLEEDLDTFEHMILFLHTKFLAVNQTNFIPLANLSKKYFVESLREKLQRWLEKHPECEDLESKQLAIADEREIRNRKQARHDVEDLTLPNSKKPKQ